MAQNKKKRNQNNRTKVTLLCTGPEWITTHNKERNEEVRATCFQEVKFKPRINCVGCRYLETRTYA